MNNLVNLVHRVKNIFFLVDDDTNRYTSIAGNAITHDDAGNLIADKDGNLYDYDYENRIVQISRDDGDSAPTTVAESVAVWGGR